MSVLNGSSPFLSQFPNNFDEIQSDEQIFAYTNFQYDQLENSQEKWICHLGQTFDDLNQQTDDQSVLHIVPDEAARRKRLNKCECVFQKVESLSFYIYS